MPLTLEEVKEAVKDAPELLKSIIGFTNETEKGKEILDNYAKKHWGENIGDEVKKIHNLYDKDVKDVLGLDKPSNMKTYEHVKGLLSELKDLKSKNPGKKSEEIKKLEETIAEMKKSGSHNEHWKKTYEEAQEKWKTSLEEKETTIKGLNDKQTKNIVSIDLAKGVSSIKFDEKLPKTMVDTFVKSIETELTQHAVINEDGTVHYMGADGKTIFNKDHAPATAEEIYNDRCKEMISKTPGGGGEAGKDVEDITGKDDNKKLVLDRTKFSTKREFNNYVEKTLVSNGVDPNSKDGMDLTDAAYETYKVGEMELQ